jgi:WD40 repeat protein/tRNA A-37 threonylcarbamoyl transferase component Bud32
MVPALAVPLIPGYEILEEIGRGGMGVVYKARQVKANRLVALKMILARKNASLEQQIRFQIEVEAVARFQHPNIVQLHDVGEHEGRRFFSLEYCDGGALDERLQGKPLPAREAAALVEKLARAMHYAHLRGVVHRDLKPANVLLTADGQLKIADFGLAKRLGGNAVSRSGAVMGTPSYMSPEQAEGRFHDFDPRTDVYALGALLYECLTGRPPFEGPAHRVILDVLNAEPAPPSRLNAKVPRDLETVCLKCLRKQPARRYASAAELADRLRLYLDGKPIPDRAVGGLERAAMWARRRPGTAALVMALVLVSALGVAGVMWKYLDAEAERNKAQDLADKFRQSRDEADERRQAAERAEREAHEETTRAEWLTYASKLTRAQQRWRAGNVDAAHELLESCRPDYRGWEYAYLSRTFDQTYRTLPGHVGPVFAACFSPDGHHVAAGGGEPGAPGELLVWDTATRMAPRAFRGHSDRVRGACFSPDGRQLATASDDRTVIVWDVKAGTVVRILRGRGKRVHSVCFSPDGRQLAGAAEDQTIKVWAVATGEELCTLAWHADRVTGVCFSPDGSRLASVGDDGAVVVGVPATREKVFTIHETNARFRGVCFSADGRLLAAGRDDTTITVWDAAGGQRLRTLRGNAGPVAAVCFSPDGRLLASAGGSLGRPGEVKVWDWARGLKSLALKGHTNRVRCVRFSPDGKLLLTGSADGTVKLWDPTTDQEFRTLSGQQADVRGVSWSARGDRLASASDDRTVRVWDADSGATVGVLEGHTEGVRAVCFGCDGLRLASAAADQTAKVWDVATGETLLTLRGHSAVVTGVSFDPEGRQVVTSSADGSLKVWDAETGALLHTLEGHTGAVTCVCHSADGGRLASGSADRSVIVWNAETGRALHFLRGHTKAVTSVRFSADDKYLVSGSEDRSVIVWDANSFEPVHTLLGHAEAVTGVAFVDRSGCERVASASRSGRVKIWDLTTGHELLTLTSDGKPIWCVALTPDGRRFAGGCANNAVTIWEAPR